MRVFAVIFLFIVALLPKQLTAQNCTVNGLVQDQHGHVLAGASISANNSTHFYSSNSQGEFKASIPCTDSLHLLVSFIGFKSVDTVISLKQSVKLVIQLEATNTQLHELAITAFKPNNGLVKTRSFSSEEIKNSDQGTLMKTLEAMPGIQAINTGVGVSKPVIRGQSMSRVDVINNGLKQEGQQWGADHGLEIDQYNVDEVELVRGVDVLRFSSASVNGLLNVNQLKNYGNDTLNANLLGLYKSNNGHFAGSFQMGIAKNNWFGQLRYTSVAFGDYKVPTDSFNYNRYQIPLKDGVLVNTAGKEQNYSGTIGRRFLWGSTRLLFSSYNLNAGIFKGAVGIPRAYEITDDKNSRNIDVPSQRVNHNKITSITKIFRPNENELEIIAGYQNNRRVEYSKPHAHGNVAVNSTEALKLNLHTANLNFLYKWKGGNLGQQQMGVDVGFQENKVGGFEFLIPAYNSTKAHFFYSLKKQLSPSISFDGGVRAGFLNLNASEGLVVGSADSNNNGIAKRTAAFTKNYWNWSLSFAVHKTLSKAQKLSLKLHKSYRNPNIAELASNGIHHGTFRHEKGNSNLQQEQGVHGELDWQLVKNVLEFDASAFASVYSNYIYLEPTAQFSNLAEGGQLFIYTQHNAVFYGGEVNARIKIKPWLKTSLGGDFVMNKNLNSQLPLPFTSPARLKLALKANAPVSGWFKNISLSLNTNYTFAQNRVDRNELSTPGYWLVNSGLNTKVKSKLGQIEFRFLVQNLFNTPYLNHLSRYRYLNIPEQGRNLILGISIPIGVGLKNDKNLQD